MAAEHRAHGPFQDLLSPELKTPFCSTPPPHPHLPGLHLIPSTCINLLPVCAQGSVSPVSPSGQGAGGPKDPLQGTASPEQASQWP